MGALARGRLRLPRHRWFRVRRLRRIDGHPAPQRSAGQLLGDRRDTAEHVHFIAFSWRPGPRRVLILAGAALYFAMRVWTYLAFVPARLGWADEDHAAQVLTAVERRQAAQDTMLNDPRWALLLAMMAIFLIAAHLSRVREQKLLSLPAVMST